MNVQKIVITGASAISCLGTGFDKLCTNPLPSAAASTVKKFEFHEFDQDIPCFRITDFDPVAVLGKPGLRTKDWSTKLLLGTMELGFKAVFDGAPADEKPGICVGTAFGSVASIGDFLSDSIVNGVNNVNPQAFANTVINAPAGNANIRYEARTMSTTVSTGFNAGADALVYSCDRMRGGYLSSIVAGGLEEISYYALLGMQRTGVLSRSGRMLPFGVAADGFVAGEGCAMFLLETEQSARSRGAAPLAEIAGYCAAFDPDTGPAGFGAKGEGLRYAMQQACADAGIDTKEIGFVAASASGTAPADAIEAAAIADIFGRVPTTAYKARFGECYGASAPLSCACALADMKHGRVSGPASRYEADGRVNLVFGSPEPAACEYALVNSFSCDGNCTSIVLKNIT